MSPSLEVFHEQHLAGPEAPPVPLARSFLALLAAAEFLLAAPGTAGLEPLAGLRCRHRVLVAQELRKDTLLALTAACTCTPDGC